MAHVVERAALPADVRLDETELDDLALGMRHPLSPSGVLFVRLLTAGGSLDQTRETLARRLAVPVEQVDADLRAFVHTLNEAGLLNVRPDGWRGRWAGVWLALRSALLTGMLPRARAVRFPVRSASAWRAQADIVRGLVGDPMHWWPVAATLCAGAWLLPPSRLEPLVLMPALLATIATHEAGHAWAVARRGGGCYLRVRGVAASIVYGRQYASGLVAAAGALAAAAWGIVLLTGAAWSGSAALAVASTPFVAQTLALTVLAADGRRLILGRRTKGTHP